ncbi:hypothetical protein FRB97_002522 [Tulasnella sp. 331]|nr:hypothetical protein FRB97_002522 [Tulasnella sp. 331]
MSSRYPSMLGTGGGSSHLKPKTSRSRREPSGVFTLFQPAQIQQFKEAFSLIDQDGDGMVTEADLKSIFASLGITPTRHMMDALLNARPGGDLPDTMDKGVNFTMFLTMMGEHLLELDAEAELLEAFESFDENDEGKVKCDELRPFTDRQGFFNYREWVKVLRVNADEDGTDHR